MNSPRIRGDGPPEYTGSVGHDIFSPYSRGWSRIYDSGIRAERILPVVAGTVPIK